MVGGDGYSQHMSRPHTAAVVEDAWHRRVERVLQGRGWGTRVVPFVGYGTVDSARVLARVLLGRRADADAEAEDRAESVSLRPVEAAKRGWRAFVTAPAMDAPVTVTLGDQVVDFRSDRSGLVDLVITGHGLSPGWHQAVLEVPHREPVNAEVRIMEPGARLGLISDIDDTIISTSLPRPLIAAWNTFVRREHARHVVPGMATLYRALLESHPDAPIVYVSTGAWNTAPHLYRFLRHHGYPAGPILLTDWGPTNTGWFRSGQDHKRACLHRLAREFPQVRWILVGDDGQHDPKIYGDFAEDRPEAVEAIAIRELSPAEQVLSHGIPVSNEEFAVRPRRYRRAPVCRAPDGYALRRLIQSALAGD